MMIENESRDLAATRVQKADLLIDREPAVNRDQDQVLGTKVLQENQDQVLGTKVPQENQDLLNRTVEADDRTAEVDPVLENVAKDQIQEKPVRTLKADQNLTTDQKEVKTDLVHLGPSP